MRMCIDRLMLYSIYIVIFMMHIYSSKFHYSVVYYCLCNNARVHTCILLHLSYVYHTLTFMLYILYICVCNVYRSRRRGCQRSEWRRLLKRGGEEVREEQAMTVSIYSVIVMKCVSYMMFIGIIMTCIVYYTCILTHTIHYICNILYLVYYT